MLCRLNYPLPFGRDCHRIFKIRRPNTRLYPISTSQLPMTRTSSTMRLPNRIFLHRPSLPLPSTSQPLPTAPPSPSNFLSPNPNPNPNPSPPSRNIEPLPPPAYDASIHPSTTARIDEKTISADISSTSGVILLLREDYQSTLRHMRELEWKVAVRRALGKHYYSQSKPKPYAGYPGLRKADRGT